ncbi:hypothetical protein ABLV17_12170 [Klebsiella sp. CN_Kp091]|uniref:hypothetical protein n=1 Tax=unclassified Klebsiella TaxID=2608929 RepID=UPI0032B523F1
MKYLAYIESPLQAFNLMEYVNNNDITVDLLVINKKSAVSNLNYSQICYVLKYFKYREVISTDIESNRHNIAKIKEFAKSIPSLGSEPVSLIGGEYRSLIFWFIAGQYKKRKLFILDDGTATLRLNRRTRSFKHLIRDKIYGFLGCVDNFVEPINFISVYPIADKISLNDSVVTHQYNYFRHLTNSFSNEENTIYIIGVPLLEAGVITGDDIALTLSLIVDLESKYKNDCKNLVYIPHRRERKDKIDIIGRKVNVKYLEYPFELLPLVSGNNVKHIAGFYSSLFDNMVSIYAEQLVVDSYYVPSAVVTPDWIDFVKNLYNNYEKYDSQTFKLNNL